MGKEVNKDTPRKTVKTLTQDKLNILWIEILAIEKLKRQKIFKNTKIKFKICQKNVTTDSNCQLFRCKRKAPPVELITQK